MNNINEKIAIIGISCKFPKAKNLFQLWENLINGKDCITHFRKKTDNKIKTVTARGILDDIEYFDADYFGISEQEASIMDPQHRLFITHCLKSIENAGYNPKALEGKVGVFASSADSTYLHSNLLLNEKFNKNNFKYRTNTLTSSGFLATRVSYLLNFTGPSINLNVACSSSLVGIIYACKALINSEADICLAGGVSIKCPQDSEIPYKSSGIFSLDGVCRPFDKNATGTVSSNGVGVVMLKRLSKAVEDKDNIIAVISGYAINNDGASKVSYTAPSVEKQTDCIKAAVAHAGIEAHDIGYIEAHGTATSLGDMIEIQALKNAFHKNEENLSCAIGSIKSNIGHTDMASGVAGVIKSALLVYNKTMVPTIHHESVNPSFELSESPFYINTTLRPWNLVEGQSKRIAGVNSLGIGGTNAHLVIEEYKDNHNMMDALHHVTALTNEKKYWITPTFSRTQSENDSDRQYLYFNTPYWELLEIGKYNLNTQKVWVVFAEKDDISDMLIDLLQKTNQNIIVLFKENNTQGHLQNSYQFDPDKLSECAKARNFIESKINFIDNVVYLWSNNSEEASPLTNLRNIFHEVLYQAIDENTNVFLMTKNSVVLSEKDELIPLNAMIHGFGLVLSQEFRLKCRTYDINQSEFSDRQTLINLLMMPAGDKLHQVIACRSNILFKKSIKPWRPKQGGQNEIKSQCNIVITGGFGSIGLSIAELFAKKYNANILLIAHKVNYPLAENKVYLLSQCASILNNKLLTFKLSQIDESASSLKIIFSDISDYNDLKNIFEKYTKTVNVIDYIFHLAAKINKKSKHSIHDISDDEVQAQISPKLNGLINIKKLTDDFDILRVVVFSSIATFVGGLTMATYASVNMAVDSYFSSIADDNTQWLCLNWDAWPRNNFNSKTNYDKHFSERELALDSLIYILNNVAKNKTQLYVSSTAISSLISRTTVKKIDKFSPKNDLIPIVSRFFLDCLGVEEISDNDDFFELGGDSLSAIELIDQIEKKMSITISHEFLYRHRTINTICQALSKKHTKFNYKIFQINNSNGKPIFLFHPLSGMNNCYISLTKNLEPNYSCYCIQDPEIEVGKVLFDNFNDMVDSYYNLIKTIKNNGEFILIGYSFGGSIAHAVAKRLEIEGYKNITLFIIDAWASFSNKLRNQKKFKVAIERHTKEILNRVSNKFIEENLVKLLWHRMQMLFNYKQEVIESSIYLVKANKILDEYKSIDHPSNHWDHYTNNKVYVHELPFDHNTIIDEQPSLLISKFVVNKLNRKVESENRFLEEV